MSDTVGCTAANKHDNVAKGDMVRCCICMVWFHTKCVPGEATDGIWTCHKCGRMPSQMAEMTEAMNHMATELQKPTKFCNNADLKYREEVNGLRNTNTLLTAENSKLVSELDKLKKETKNQGERLPSSPRRNLLIGGSLLRRVATKNLGESDVKSVGNSLIVDATRTISNVTDSYNNITLVVGGNDCDKPSPPSAESVRHDFEELINTSLTKAESVTVCGICPRVTTEDINKTILSVNAELVALCEEKDKVTFVDIDPMFKLSDGSFNDGYLMGDGVHLTDKALNKIALKLNLRMKDKDGGCVTDRIQMRATFGDEGWLTVPSDRTGQTNNIQSQSKANVQTSPEGWKTVNYHTTKGQGLGVKRRPVSYAEVISHTTSSWCYNCGESGHICNSCRFNAAVKCHKCHRLGHKQKLCHLYK